MIANVVKLVVDGTSIVVDLLRTSPGDGSSFSATFDSTF